MCGRFYLDADFDEVLRHYFDVVGDYPIDDYEPKEIFPSNAIPVVHRGKKSRENHSFNEVGIRSFLYE